MIRDRFDQAMASGEAEYKDVLQALSAAGHRATFTQTGGMNAGLEVLLEGGWALLITDAEDSLSWMRAEQRGWGVGLYAPEERYDAPPRGWADADVADVATLERLIAEVLRSAAVTMNPSG